MIDEYKKASGDVWLFFRSHFERQDEDYWEKVIYDADAVAKKYEGTPVESYVRKYVIMCIDELKRKHREVNK